MCNVLMITTEDSLRKRYARSGVRYGVVEHVPGVTSTRTKKRSFFGHEEHHEMTTSGFPYARKTVSSSPREREGEKGVLHYSNI